MWQPRSLGGGGGGVGGGMGLEANRGVGNVASRQKKHGTVLRQCQMIHQFVREQIETNICFLELLDNSDLGMSGLNNETYGCSRFHRTKQAVRKTTEPTPTER